jgi:acyl carrier protein
MDRQAVERTITDHIVGEFLYDRTDVELDSEFPLVQEGVVDSLGIFRLVAFLQDSFGISIAEEDVALENFVDIGAITRLVLSKLDAASGAGGG